MTEQKPNEMSNAAEASSASIELVRIANKGIQLCREGQWRKGLGYLAAVAENRGRALDLPGRFYSYLGYGIAQYQKRYKEGLDLCRHAVEIEFYQPENFLNLARTYLLLDARGSAIRAVEKGLRLDPENRELQRLRLEVGNRLRPILPFLSRSNPLNRLLGKVRYVLMSHGSREAEV